MSIDDVSARAKRYTQMTKVANDEDDEVIYPTNGRYVLQIHTLEIHKKQRRCGFRNHGCS